MLALKMFLFVSTVEFLYSGHHWEHLFLYSKVSLTQELWCIPGSVVCVIGMLSTMWLRLRAFSCCTLAEKAKQRLILRVTLLI